jgi:hypothetical protein
MRLDTTVVKTNTHHRQLLLADGVGTSKQRRERKRLRGFQDHPRDPNKPDFDCSESDFRRRKGCVARDRTREPHYAYVCC